MNAIATDLKVEFEKKLDNRIAIDLDKLILSGASSAPISVVQRLAENDNLYGDTFRVILTEREERLRDEAFTDRWAKRIGYLVMAIITSLAAGLGTYLAGLWGHH